MSNAEQATDRPLLITGLCLIGAVGVGFAVIRVFQQWDLLVQQPTPWLLAALLALAVSAVCLYGFWRMKRWAVILLAVALVARVGWSAVTDQPLILTRTLGPLLLLAVGLVYLRRMD